ncbi:hypothetical protein Q4Q35_07065 [Flavivirga aquimarina]|uniref:DUF4145 domain-containing protein n=1 Tax=Flavivirga aquimarina TaxID=2027862 RepID=A0ABT8W8V4_9FLAO|nr:hypothetical protein [Flavivirga aquimarina]MDO5969561.1 hypothetical protein [Flavivirga aquimarina]
MSTQNGQNVCPKCKSVNTSDDTRHVSKKVRKDLYPAQLELLEFISFQDTLELIKSLEWVHNTALYHSHSFIEEEEKSILFNIRLLMDKLNGIAREV